MTYALISLVDLFVLRLRLYAFTFSLAIIALSSCVSSNLKQPEYKDKQLLYQQKISDNKSISDEKIKEYFQQETNRKILGALPYLKAYFIGKDFYSKEKIEKRIEKIEKRFKKRIENNEGNEKKIKKLKEKRKKKILKQEEKLEEGNWMMTTVGEKPVWYDSAAVAKTAEQIELLYQSKGFFNASVGTSFSYKKKNRRVIVEYRIVENKPHKFGEITHQIEDPEIRKLVDKTENNSFIKTGQNYEVESISKERDRLHELMKNNGYFDFQRQYMFFEIDTTGYGKTADVNIVIEDPSSQERHIKYTIKEVHFNIEASQESKADTTLFKGINYIHGTDEKVAYNILHQDVRVRPDSSYSYLKTQQTQRLLGNIDIFKYVNINYQKADSSELVAYVGTRLFQKYQIAAEGGINLNVNQGQSIPGPNLNLNFKNRKVFNGFEILETNLNYGIQGQASFIQPDIIYRSREIGINTSLIFPRLLLPRAFKNKTSDLTTRSRIKVGFSNVKRREYERTNLQFAGIYSWVKSNERSYSLTPIDINIVNTSNTIQEFDDYLTFLQNNNGINLQRSFEPSIISSSNFNFVINNNDLTKNIEANYFNLYLEAGGYGMTAYNALSPNNPITQAFGLPVYQFIKINPDYRHYIPTSKEGTFAFRIHAGIASPYDNTTVLPYEKFFFSGGLNSVRAWSPRRLGPGSYKPTLTNSNELSYRFEQPGEIIFEANLELRQKIIGFIHGAVFADFGNVWMTTADPTRPGAEFSFDNLHKEIAVGSGAGLRFDFSFLIFRFDVGVKVWDPARQIVVPLDDQYSRTYNVGIGYPF